jgi:hypothetical protein
MNTFVANTNPSLELMREQLLRYFVAEKHESLIFMFLGLVAIFVGVWLLLTSGYYSRFQGMAYPFIAVAFVQIIVGSTVYFRTDAQIASLTQQLVAAPAQYKADEIKRMDVVNKNFTMYKIAEIVLLIVGIAITLLWQHTHPTLYAVGLGLFVQSALMLAADLFAEDRAYTYLAAIHSFVA